LSHLLNSTRHLSMPRKHSVLTLLASVVILSTVVAATAQEATPPAGDTATNAEAARKETPEGHSLHGEIFNDGPRQAAYPMTGVGTVHFDVTTQSDEARAFVLQGIGQMHGFWYFESERSFRQAAMLDPDCAIAYWGMAYSNRRNADRTKGFIKKAMDHKDKASPREQRYIEAYSRYANAKAETSDEKKKRAEKYISDLEELLLEFPDDIEAKAFLCEYIWSARREGIKMVSYLTVDALIQDVLDVEPLHPVHHYRIHLWDTKKADRALESAARCGLAAPQIAHMWHMPGHIYSRLKRYHDAVYQQEASARVDHAHMMKDLVLPDQIHNFAHNNEWCIRNLIHIGQVNDAIALAQNMMGLPRHPKYNHIGKFGSFKYGRQRLLDVLRTYQLHDQMIALSETPYLEDCGNDTEDLKRDRYLAAALVAVGTAEKATPIRQKIETLLNQEKKKQKEAGDKAQKEAEKAKKDVKKARKTAEDKHGRRIRDLEKAVQEIDGRIAVANGKYDEALELFKKAGGIPVEEQVAVMLQAGKTDDAVKKITDYVGSNRGEVRPLTAQIETLWAAKKNDEAKKSFDQLRNISSTIDIAAPAFARLKPIATELGFDDDWRTAAVTASDIGARPPLDSLGPLHWQPVPAPHWSLADVQNQPRALSDYRDKPVVMIFYLGFGCLHCAEQLQKFAPETEKFRAAGIDVVAVSTDKQELLDRAYKDLEDGFPFPLVSDDQLNVFKRYRCYDDFESQPLHGTFLIDGEGRIRWQDISYEPFMDPDFVLQEAQRLLGQDESVSKPLTDQVTATP